MCYESIPLKDLESILSIVKGFHFHPLECYLQNPCPTADLQRFQKKKKIEKLALSLHMSSTSSVTRPEVDVFYHLFIFLYITNTMFGN